MDQWIPVITESLDFAIMTEVSPTKGNLVYEYNPLRNYRLQYNMYFFKDSWYNLYELHRDFGICPKNVVLYKRTINNISYYSNTSISSYLLISDFKKELEYVYTKSNNSTKQNFEEALIKTKITLWEDQKNILDDNTNPILFEKGLLVDFVTDELKVSIEHPVNIIPQYSYDGSVNLIINDGINVPRLINSRFSATGKNTYEVVDRKGNNDTNIYDLGDQFDIDTSLYKRVVKIPKITFIDVELGGNLKVGNYHFYFKLSDADGNETDFVGESGLVSVFIGYNDPKSATSGQKNENSIKSVKFLLSNIDTSYDYVFVYYSRSTAEGKENSITEYAKIQKKYVVNNAAECSILVTGFEETIPLTVSDINLNYNVVDAANTLAVCQNMLFLGNVHKPDIPYNELLDLSLRFLPYIKETPYTLDMDYLYNITSSTKGYYDPKFIYNNTGYWNNEFYRFGIVYIMPNNELTPVFNIRGRYKVKPFIENSNFLEYGNFNDGLYNHYYHYDSQNNKISILAVENTNYVVNPDSNEGKIATNKSEYENSKGVITFDPNMDTNMIYSLDIRTDDETIQELKKYVKGYFFVRQTRIPTILALGVTIGLDKESRTPTIPTAEGILSDLQNSLTNTYVETADINDVNYISEGFLSRYSFSLKMKSSALWKKIGTSILKVAAITALAVGASVFIPGGEALLGTVMGKVGLDVGFYATVAIASGVSGVAAGATTGLGMTTAATILEVVNVIKRTKATIKLEGRNTKVPGGYKRVEDDSSRKISTDFYDRVIIKDASNNYTLALLCPEYQLNLPYYNQIFTGNTHILRSTKTQNINQLAGYSSSFFNNDNNHFYIPSYYDCNYVSLYECKIISVPDNVKCVGIDNNLFRSRAGEAEEAWRYECIGVDYKSDKTKFSNVEDKETISNKKINTDIIRGSFGAYLGMLGYPNQPCTIVDILIPGYSESLVSNYIDIRMHDNSPFYAISERMDILDSDNYLINKLSNIIGNEDRTCGYFWNLYRGDCYICLYTHRLNRNFNDPSAPYNDEVVNENTWKDNYDPDNTEKYEQINLGDINAVQLGMWVTFKLRASSNLNIRTLDGSYVDEEAMIGHPRGYFPYHPMSTEGTYKHPESEVYNKGFNKSVSDRWNVELPDVPHIKNWFGTRIMYSDIHINDAYKNGFRVFLGTNYRDYTREYGEIVKLVPFESSLLCVFEHGIALIPINERAVAGQGAGGNVYINTSNVLPENPKIISDTFGSQWAESVLKVPGRTGDAPQYVYGVDTVAKKIWRTDGLSILCISDFRVQEFLNNNITLGERELTPKIGIRNVKTHYNAFKRDVMFTFYDNTYGFEEKVWNLCWNELLNTFVTFYSWVPSYMENINNIPFSFNRDTSKWIAKLGTSHADNSFADGITLTSVIMDKPVYKIPINYITKSGKHKTIYFEVNSNINNSNDIESLRRGKFIGGLCLSNRVLPTDLTFYNIHYTLERDNYQNYKDFGIEQIGTKELPSDAKFAGKIVPVYALFYKGDISKFYSELYFRNSAGNSYADKLDNKKCYINYDSDKKPVSLQTAALSLPIYKSAEGKRINLPRKELLNPDKLVRLLNIRATILLLDYDEAVNLPDDYYNLKAGFESGTTLMDAGYYESVVAVTPLWNLLFLSTDFWKHGQAGLIDIADDIYPTYWYGKQHPFEFEVVIVNDPSVHKIFDNIEIVSNKAKPESFHYEIVGECYDFAKDKVNMYFRLEAKKSVWLYNGSDITYNRNYLKLEPNKLVKSADFPHRYYYRQDTINEIEDYYDTITLPDNSGYSYKHLSGAELVYYKNRLEYRIWQHSPAVDLNSLSLDKAYSLIASNCQYLEDKWRVVINPIIICYKNENWGATNRPPLTVMNSPLPNVDYKTSFELPDELVIKGYGTSSYDIDLSNWLDDRSIYGTSFGAALNRKELDLKDKFMKVRIRYSGEELAVIDFLNTIYRISYA